MLILWVLLFLLVVMISYVIYLCVVSRRNQRNFANRVDSQLMQLKQFYENKTKNITLFDNIGGNEIFAVGESKLISTSNDVWLNHKYGSYRIDTDGNNTIRVYLPTATTIPSGQFFMITKTQNGLQNTIHFMLNSPNTDQFNSSSLLELTSTNPVYTLTCDKNEQILLYSDGISTWFALNTSI